MGRGLAALVLGAAVLIAEPALAEDSPAMKRGKAALAAKRYQEAIGAFTQAIAAKPENFEEGMAFQFRGEAKSRLGDCKAAMVDFEEAFALLTISDGSLFYEMGLCQHKLGNFQDAIEILELVVKEWPHNQAAVNLLADARARLKAVPAPKGQQQAAAPPKVAAAPAKPAVAKKASPALERGMTALDAKNYREALAAFDEYLKTKHDRSDEAIAYRFRGEAKAGLNDCKGALADYEKAIDLFGVALGDIHYYTASCKFQLQRYDDASLDLTFYLSDYPNDVPGLTLLGRAQINSKEFAAAEKTYRTFVAAHPDSDYAKAMLGVVLENLLRSDEAMALYTQAVRQQPANHVAQAGLGRTLYFAGRYNEAIVPLAAALRLKPDDADATQLLAWARAKLAAPGGPPPVQVAASPSRSSSSSSSTPAPSRPVASTTPAPQVAEAVAYRPIDPASPFGRGVALYRAFDMQPALAQLLVAVKADPNDARIHAFLGATYDSLGMTRESKAAFETATRLDPKALDVLRR